MTPPDLTVSRIAEKLAQTLVRNFWISLDSYIPRVHEKMRGFRNLFDGIATALPLFEQAGIYPSVNLGINRNLGGEMTSGLFRRDFSSNAAYKNAVYETYRTAFSRFYQTVIDLGFTIANACYPMSVDDTGTDLEPVYQASAPDRVVRFSKDEKEMIFKALNHTIPLYRDRIRIFSPQTGLHALVQSYRDTDAPSYPCLGGISYFFIDAQTGNTYPCGYRGNDNLGRFPAFNRKKHAPTAHCRKCDWECFRDPSELVGPLVDFFSSPALLAKKILNDPLPVKFWVKDLLYYRACDFFNGRTPPDYKKMKRFSAGL